MTFKELCTVLAINNIPDDVVLNSDSGWECGPTKMDGLYYNESKNLLVFTQNGDGYDCGYYNNPNWKHLHGWEESE